MSASVKARRPWLCFNPSDLIMEGKAEMAHNSKNRLAEIKAPTLVIAGDKDYFCQVERLR
ncbi:alpha/beta hydrolase [Candidatus Bathyarchaeota archaeon A05DMB-2]|jgi:pimeloyl-ACP methyl ester carboxylesterase|nr:alpha/beta hydrolase [Candidatus Bathyarchaeota archaeon A05DMB-2]